MGGVEVRGVEEWRREITDKIEQREHREGQCLHAIQNTGFERIIGKVGAEEDGGDQACRHDTHRGLGAPERADHGQQQLPNHLP